MKLSNQNAGVLLAKGSLQVGNPEGNQVGMHPGEAKIDALPEKGYRYDGISNNEMIWRVPEENKERAEE